MSAIEWKKTTLFVQDVRDCTNGCVAKTGSKMAKVGVWSLTIIGHDAGTYCDPCKKQMSAAWVDALDPVVAPVAVAA